MTVKGKVEQGVAFAGVEIKLVTVAGDSDGLCGNSGGEGVVITGVVGRIEVKVHHGWRRGVAETIRVIAKGNIIIVIVVAFATFCIRFQENRIDFGAELKQRLDCIASRGVAELKQRPGCIASRGVTFGDGRGILANIVLDVFLSHRLQYRGCGN